jgi:single-strand DNA-binding protein
MNGTINKVILIGHLGDNVKMHYFDGGNSIGRFPLATNDSYLNKQTGERIVNTEWHNIVVRNKLAEIFEKYARKGDKVYLEGRLRTRKWTGEDGRERYTTEIHVTEFTFLSPKTAKDNQSGQNPQTSQPAEQPAQNQEPLNSSGAEIPEDDLPF